MKEIVRGRGLCLFAADSAKEGHGRRHQGRAGKFNLVLKPRGDDAGEVSKDLRRETRDRERKVMESFGTEPQQA